MRRLTRPLLQIACLAVPLAIGAQVRSLNMSGVVIDSQSKNPVKGARVLVIGDRAKSPTTTDSDGTFVLTLAEGVEEGSSIRVRIEKSGYVTYDKWVPVSSAIPLRVLLVAEKHARPGRTSVAPIAKSERFLTFVPLHPEFEKTPIPINWHHPDPHEDFYSDLAFLANCPDKTPEGWPTCKKRDLESPDGQFTFVTRLIQYYVFRSIYYLQRTKVQEKWKAGVGLTVSKREHIVPPDATPYPTEVVLQSVSGSEFLRPFDEQMWAKDPLTLPAGAREFVMDLEDQANGGRHTYRVRLERPGYFRIDFDVRGVMSMNNMLPAGFSAQGAAGTKTLTVSVEMNYEIKGRKDAGFEPDKYAAWADTMFDGLKKQMGFDSTQ
jgi:Carboxypeptidase regulatory-like domain